MTEKPRIGSNSTNASALLDPLELIKDCRDGFRNLVPYDRLTRQRLLLQAYIVARLLLESRDRWTAFLDQCPRNIAIGTLLPATHSERAVMRFVMLFAMGAATEESAKEARRYADGMYPYLAARADAEVLEQDIGTLGIYRLIKSAEHDRRSPKLSGSQSSARPR